MYEKGMGVEPSHVVASALFKLAATDPSASKSVKKAQEGLSKSMSPKEVAGAEELSREMLRPGNLLKALDGYVNKQQAAMNNNADGTHPAPGSSKNHLELFGVSLKGATRDQMRVAFKKNGMHATREDNQYWVDTYDAAGVLDGATDFKAGYVSASGKFAYAQYTFPGFMDTQLVGKIINMVSIKYGRPTSQYGDYGLGAVNAKWNMAQDMQVVVSRGWPDTTTTLQFIDPSALRQMNAEIDSEKQSQATKKAKAQSNAF